MIVRPPKLPTYNEKVDGPVFAWILRAAKAVRRERRQQHGLALNQLREDRLRWLPREAAD